MSQGRGSALYLVTIMMIMFATNELAEAASMSVGGNNGWTFNVATWPRGKRFRAGDTLVFNYNPSFHNVVAVDKAGYDNCNASGSAKTFMSGRDQIKLRKGMNYFICSIPGHCGSGMKIAVNAA